MTFWNGVSRNLLAALRRCFIPFFFEKKDVRSIRVKEQRTWKLQRVLRVYLIT